jgi:KDO2-lipid IV(A) lauroyltransferase
VLAERLPGQRYRISLQAPVLAPDLGRTQPEQALDMTAAMMARFEAWVRERPAQWMCLSRRFPKDLDKSAGRG